MKCKRCPSDSTDSEDSQPLGSVKRPHVENTNAYHSLVRQSWEQCEFCDKTFSDRYSSIIHNGTHIIIPLIKHTVHQCTECLFYFTSLDDLRTHTKQKHQKSLVIIPALNQDGLLERYIDCRSKIPDILQSIVEKQVVVKCQDELRLLQGNIYDPFKSGSPERDQESLQNGSITPEVTDNQFIPTYEISSDDDGPSPVKERSSPSHSPRQESQYEPVGVKELSSPNDKEPSSPDHEPIRSRLMFEDDIDDLFEAEEILPDKPYRPECNTQNKVTNQITYNGKKNSYIFGNQLSIDGKKNSLNLGHEISDTTYPSFNINSFDNNLTGVLNSIEYSPSVHYDELTEYNVVDCRYCGRCFGTRLDLIQHETSHLRLRQFRLVLCCVCERYIAGNYKSLRKHIAAKHPDEIDRKHQIQKCKKCHLKYHNYFRHIRYYHQIYKCCTCQRNFDKEQLEKHRCDEVVLGPNVLTMDKYRVIKMCEMCLSFVRNTQNIHYEVIGEHSEVGVRQICEKCNCKFFEIKLVKRKVTYRDAGDGLKAKKKVVTNEDRLKKMQNRLKEINKRNKCCFVVLFILQTWYRSVISFNLVHLG